ncbi:MAG TPA: MFS transporter, partial [Deltaproteobacteria bacterium]|nr:MFS transporter [Deltaproteobacteria bacterium]
MKFNSREQRQKMILLGGLYTSQFLGISFVITALPAILRQSGVGLGKISWIYGLGFIWSISFLWAPLIDRFGSRKYGHYRSWILVMQILLILVMIGASFFTVPDQLSILMFFFAFIAVFSSTQDIATDALAVTILKPEERGTGNSIQSAGNLVGSMIGGGIVLVTYQWLGWQGSMLVLAVGIALPLISILAYRERQAPVDSRKEKVDYSTLIRFFRRPRIWRWITVLLAFRMNNMIIYGLLNPTLVDLGWSLDRIGYSINIIGPFFGIAGAGMGGWIVNRWGRKNAMLFTMLLIILATLCLLVPARGIDNSMIVYTIIGLIMAAYGTGFTVMYTIIMDKSDPAAAGTDFTLQISISGIFAFAAVGLALNLAETIGYSGVLVGCLGIGIVSMIMIWLYDDFE